MGRPREFDNDEVLTALQDVFWQYGYEGTSYANIMKATGLQKGSLYAAFGDKRALYLQALAQYDISNVTKGAALLRDTNLSGQQRIDAFMQGLIDAAETKKGRWGCLLCNAAVDQAPSHKQTEELVLASMERIKSAIGTAVESTPAKDKVEIIWAAYFGGRVIIKSGAKRDTLRAIKAQVLELLSP